MRALHVPEVFVERGKQVFKQMSPDSKLGRSEWREGVVVMNPLNGSSECLVFQECTWSEG